MAFEVFTPSQVRSESEQRASKDAQRAQTLARLIDDLLKEKAEAESSFEETMKRQREEAAIWHEEETAKKTELAKEVARLEERRRQALMPPLIREEDIHSVQEELWARKLELDHKESEQEERSRLLMRKLDECSTREQDLGEREKRVKRTEQGVDIQRQQVTQSLRQLNLQMEAFEKEKAEKETEFAYRQSELDAQDNLHKERERLFEEREQEIEAARRLLLDQRIQLEKGFKELRNKQ